MKCFTSPAPPARAADNSASFFIRGIFSGLSLLLLCALLPQQGRAQAKITDVTFTQFDRFGSAKKAIFKNSSLGRFSFSAIRDKKRTYYLNVFVKTSSGDDAWAVENLPIPPTIGPSETIDCQAVAFDYKLTNLEPGRAINKISYAISVSPGVIKSRRSAPKNGPIAARIAAQQFTRAADAFSRPLDLKYTTASVTRKNYHNEASGGYKENNDLAMYENEAPMDDEFPIDYEDTADIPDNTADTTRHPDRDIPGGLDEDENGCVPGAFARSIAWLSGQNNFRAAFRTTTPRTPKDIYDTLKARMDSCELDFDCQLKVKSDYLKEITDGQGQTDQILPENQSPSDAIKDNPDCDIELGMGPAPGGGIGHEITIVNITCGNDGCCTIKYRDDDDQDNPGGDDCVKTAKICGDSITFDGSKRKILDVVTECITPSDRVAHLKKAIKEKEDIQVALLPNVPNPFDNSTMLRVQVKEGGNTGAAILTIRTDRGIELQKIKVNLQKGLNEVRYQPGPGIKGILYCTLEIGGRLVGSQKMFVQ